MKTFISILRGINVSGQKKILMADLKTLYEKLGFTDIVTYIQSGNVVFTTDEKLSNRDIETTISQAIKKKFFFDVPVIVRSGDEMKKIVAGNPFLKQKNIDPEKLHVTFLSEKPFNEKIVALSNLDFSPDSFVCGNTDIYLHCPVSYGNTKLSNTFFENKLKVTATTRNWKTVTTLVDLAMQR